MDTDSECEGFDDAASLGSGASREDLGTAVFSPQTKQHNLWFGSAESLPELGKLSAYRAAPVRPGMSNPPGNPEVQRELLAYLKSQGVPAIARVKPRPSSSGALQQQPPQQQQTQQTQHFRQQQKSQQWVRTTGNPLKSEAGQHSKRRFQHDLPQPPLPGPVKTASCANVASSNGQNLPLCRPQVNEIGVRHRRPMRSHIGHASAAMLGLSPNPSHNLGHKLSERVEISDGQIQDSLQKLRRQSSMPTFTLEMMGDRIAEISDHHHWHSHLDDCESGQDFSVQDPNHSSHWSQTSVTSSVSVPSHICPRKKILGCTSGRKEAQEGVKDLHAQTQHDHEQRDQPQRTLQRCSSTTALPQKPMVWKSAGTGCAGKHLLGTGAGAKQTLGRLGC